MVVLDRGSGAGAACMAACAKPLKVNATGKVTESPIVRETE
jgi:hypothetical protein